MLREVREILVELIHTLLVRFLCILEHTLGHLSWQKKAIKDVSGWCASDGDCRRVLAFSCLSTYSLLSRFFKATLRICHRWTSAGVDRCSSCRVSTFVIIIPVVCLSILALLSRR